MSDEKREADELQRLRDAGLWVSDYRARLWFDRACYVAKPNNVAGNSRPGYKMGFYYEDDTEGISDAPVGCIGLRNGRWFFRVHEYVPGPGPGDFNRPYRTLNKAVSAALAYYFGDPRDMNSHRTPFWWWKLKRRLAVSGWFHPRASGAAKEPRLKLGINTFVEQ